MVRDNGKPSTWVLRPDPVSRFVLSLRPLLAAGVVATILLISAPDPFELVVASILLAAGALLAVLDVVRVRLHVGTVQIRVYNRFSTYRFRVDDISAVSAGYDGLEVELTNGTVVTAAAVRRWETSPLRRSPSKADEVAAELLRRAARTEGAPVHAPR